MTYSIRKSSGKLQPFNKEKLIRSLKLAGTPPHLINEVLEKVLHQKPPTTKKLHKLVSHILHEEKSYIAARYNIKRALMDLGPAGYPFEKFVSHLFAAQGYTASTNHFIKGFCVSHEIDVVAEKDTKKTMVECKFHNRFNLKSDVKVALYTHARFEDLQKTWQHNKVTESKFTTCAIVTNTQFTADAIQYAQCTNIHLLGWAYPVNNGIETLIDKFGLHPITALTSLNSMQKRKFIKEGLVLCKDAKKQTAILKNAGFNDTDIKAFIDETTKVCALER